ncbi:MAG: hypothetical protein J5367_05195 [Lachnospiraceae bacterium]|nr:hypothetical protein [Lachnospiraceae bacterium]
MAEQTKQGLNMLNVDDLEQVTGGDDNNPTNEPPKKKMYCNDPRCKTDRIFYLYSGGRAVCSFCDTQIMY